MKKSHFGKVSLLGLLIISLTACGGGSDGGTASVSAPSSSELMAAYSGNTESAELTEHEVYPILSYLVNGDASGLIEQSQQIQEDALQELKSINQPKAMASYSENCSYGGRVTLSGNLYATTLPVRLTYTYEDCNDGYGIQSGSISYIIRELIWDDTPHEYTIIYDDYREQYGIDEYVGLDGSSVHENGGYCNEVKTSNLLITSSDINILEQDLIVEGAGCSFVRDLEVSGRIYFSYLGYVDVETLEPIELDDDLKIFSGHFIFSNELSSLSIETNESTSSVVVDSNNDGSYEFTLTSPSWYFSDQHFNDIPDDDFDGYINSEDAYPNDPERFEALTVSAERLDFNALLGAELLSQALIISGTNIDWTVSSSEDWLQLSTLSGTGEHELEVSVLAGLSSGQHQAQITLTNNVDDTTQLITVNVEITKPTLTLSKDKIEIDLTQNWEALLQTVSLSLNNENLSYEVNYEISGADTDLMQVNIENGDSESIKYALLEVNKEALTSGQIDGLINFTANFLGESLSAELEFSILSPVRLLSVPQSGITLTKFPTVGALTRELAVLDNYGLSSAQWQANTEATWLDVSSSGTTNDKLVITADPSGLEADNFYNATITVSPIDSPITNIQTINVGLWIGSSDPAANTSLEVTYTNLTTDPVRPYVYVNNSGVDIDVYNVYTQELVSTITEVGISLGDMEVSADGERLFVADTNNDTIHIIDLDNPAYRTSWLSSDSLAAGFALSVTNNQELLISGYGNIYAAQEGLLYVTDAHGSYYGYNYLDASLYGNRFCTVDSNLTPYSASCYNLDFNYLSEQVLISEVDVSLPHGTGSNGTDIALNHNGSIAYIASFYPYVFIPIDIDTMTVLESLPAGSFPSPIAVEIGADNALHGAVVTTGDYQDVWVYESDRSLRHSEYVSGYYDKIRNRGVAVSGDGFITIAITSAPSLSFVSSY